MPDKFASHEVPGINRNGVVKTLPEKSFVKTTIIDFSKVNKISSKSEKRFKKRRGKY